MSKTVYAVLALLLAVGVFAEYKGIKASHHDAKVVADALQKARDAEDAKVVSDQLRDAAQTQANSFKTTAQDYLAKATALDDKVKVLKAKLAGMAPLPPVVSLDTVPTDKRALAIAYDAAGFAPVINGESLAFTTVQARPMLVLIEDGKNYPAAVARIGVMGEEVDTLTQQTTELNGAVANQTKRGDALDTALAQSKLGETACENEVADLKVAISAENKIISAEKPKKYLWGIVGVAGGFLLKVLLMAL